MHRKGHTAKNNSLIKNVNKNVNSVKFENYFKLVNNSLKTIQ